MNADQVDITNEVDVWYESLTESRQNQLEERTIREWGKLDHEPSQEELEDVAETVLKEAYLTHVITRAIQSGEFEIIGVREDGNWEIAEVAPEPA